MRAATATAVAALLGSALIGAAAPAARAAGFGVEARNWEAGTCTVESCTYKSVEEKPSEAFTQSAGHPPFGLTTFELNHKKGLLGEEPEGSPLKRVRVDVPTGLAADPQALAKCSKAAFEENKCSEAAPSNTRVGTNELTVDVATLKSDLTVSAPVYNLEPEEGLPLEFGIHVEALGGIVNEHVLLKGHVAWASDYHEYFEIANIEQENPVLKSKLIFFGTAGFGGTKESGDFLTLPTACSSTTTSYLEVESGSGEVARATTHTPVGVDGCASDPFSPSTQLLAETSQSDAPDGVTTDVQVPQFASSTNTADIQTARVTLPEGLTLNPPAARGLETCSPAQIAIGSEAPASCPEGSRIGTATIETDLPPHSLSGGVYLGDPAGGPLTGPPFTIYIDAEAPRYGVSVRLRGVVNANAASGRLEATFDENPQLPFSALQLTLDGGPRAPLANPLACGAGQSESLFTAYSPEIGPALSASPFTTTGCANPLPFSLAQSTAGSSLQAGAETSFTFNLARADAQQYLAQVHTTLPPGLVGMIPSVPLCPEALAQAGSCPAASAIGDASVSAGAGAEPYPFSGPVYLTGAYGGAPYGLSIPIEAAAGPFDLGRVVTRVALGVDEETGQVIATASVPTIVGGVPLRLRSVSVVVDRPGFLVNPTSCAGLATVSLLGSTMGVSAETSSAFQVGGCGALAFTPTFTSSTSGTPSKADGASLQVTITQPAHQANIRSVVTQLPAALPSRLTTLQKACPAATFAAGPRNCSAASLVGSATATTPALPGTLSGPAYLVSHGGAAFPDLDIVLEDGGVRVLLVGNTDIKDGVTTTTFAHVPDVPVSSFQLTLPMGPNSALAAYGSLCTQSLVMPTTITAQNGAQLKAETHVSVSGCGPAAAARRGVRIVRWRVKHHVLLLTVQTFTAGQLKVSGKDLHSVSRKLKRASTVTLRIPLSRRGAAALRAHRKLKLLVRVRFKPSSKGVPASAASKRVTIKR